MRRGEVVWRSAAVRYPVFLMPDAYRDGRGYIERVPFVPIHRSLQASIWPYSPQEDDGRDSGKRGRWGYLFKKTRTDECTDWSDLTESPVRGFEGGGLTNGTLERFKSCMLLVRYTGRERKPQPNILETRNRPLYPPESPTQISPLTHEISRDILSNSAPLTPRPRRKRIWFFPPNPLPAPLFLGLRLPHHFGFSRDRTKGFDLLDLVFVFLLDNLAAPSPYRGSASMAPNALVPAAALASRNGDGTTASGAVIADRGPDG